MFTTCNAGIVVNSSGTAQTGKTASLHFTLVAQKDNSGANYYMLRVQLVQEVVLQRDPTIKVQAITWEGGSTGYSAGQKPFARTICHGVFGFVLAYNSVNAPDKVKPPTIADMLCSQP